MIIMTEFTNSFLFIPCKQPHVLGYYQVLLKHANPLDL